MERTTFGTSFVSIGVDQLVFSSTNILCRALFRERTTFLTTFLALARLS
jgi:hypothetical protein